MSDDREAAPADHGHGHAGHRGHHGAAQESAGHGDAPTTAATSDAFAQAMREGSVVELAAAVAHSGDFARDELMRQIQERFGNAVADQVLEATSSPTALLASVGQVAGPQSMGAAATRRRHPASDRAAGGAERATASLATIDEHLAAFAAARDQLDVDGVRRHGEAIARLFEHAGAAQEDAAAAGATVTHPGDGDLAQQLAAAMTPVLERAAAEVGPHRFAGQAVGGAPPVHAAGNPTLAVMRLRAEAERTIALVDIAAKVRDLWVGADGQPGPEVQRAIGAQLAALGSRPVHFAFVKAALTSVGIWDHVATYHAPKAERDPATFGGILADAAAGDRTVAELDHDVARQARQFGAMVDLHGFDQATAIELLEGDTGITYLDNQQSIVSRSAKHAPQVLAMMGELDAAGRSAVLEHFRRANVLDLFCGGLPWRQVEALDKQLVGGYGDVRREIEPYYVHRDTTDHSLGHLLEKVPGVGGALESVANVATFGFLRTHDRAYRAEREGIITDQQFAEITVDAGERAGAAIALSAVGGGLAGGLAKGAAGVALGEAATTTVAGRLATTVAVGTAGGAGANVGAQLGSDLVDHRLSGAETYAHDALTGAELGAVIGGGAGVASEATAALAARAPAVAERLARLTERFPTLPPDGPIMEALTGLGEHTGAAAARGVIRVAVTPTQLIDALAARALEASPAVRAAIARAAARGDALSARALKAVGIEPGGFGGPPPALAGVPAGPPTSDLITIELTPGLTPDAAATIVKAETVEPASGPAAGASTEPTPAETQSAPNGTSESRNDTKTAPAPTQGDAAAPTTTSGRTLEDVARAHGVSDDIVEVLTETGVSPEVLDDLLRRGVTPQDAALAAIDYGATGIAAIEKLVAERVTFRAATETLRLADELGLGDELARGIASGHLENLPGLRNFLRQVSSEVGNGAGGKLNQLRRALLEVEDAKSVALEGRKQVHGDPDSGQADLVNYSDREAVQLKTVTSAKLEAVINNARYAVEEQLSGAKGEHPPIGYRRVAEVHVTNPNNPLYNASRDEVLVALRGQFQDIAALDLPDNPGQLVIMNGLPEPLVFSSTDLR